MLRPSIGNGKAKELICMTHRHEQRRGDHQRECGILDRQGQRGKNWDNCNSIINKNKIKIIWKGDKEKVKEQNGTIIAKLTKLLQSEWAET